jgi:uncharacterized protein YjeT (DUF2065 family)
MNFKLSEILVIALALAVPIALFGVMLTPGAWDSLVGFVLSPENRWTVFGGGAALAGAILLFRLARRFGPQDADKTPQAPQLSDFFWRHRRK